MAFFNWVRWLRSERRSPIKTNRQHDRKSHRLGDRPKFRPGFENLEDRLAPATLPAALVSAQGTFAGGYSPNMVVDPLNVNRLFEVHSGGGTIQGNVSTDGGQTWSNFASIGTLTDPNI